MGHDCLAAVAGACSLTGMELTDLGRTGVRISRLGLGTMAFGGDADPGVSKSIYAAARDAGINFFDCADVYNKGQAEQILGDLIAAERDQVVITTKAYFPTGSGPNDRGASRYHLVNAVEASLRRLNTDRIDVFFLHRFDDVTALDETLRGVEQLVQQGKILYPAASNFSAWQAMRALGVAEQRGWAPLTALQPMYNLVKRQAQVELLPMARAMNLAFIPYSPLAGGLLTGKYGKGRRPESGRLMDNKMYQVRYGDDHYYEAAERFTQLASKLGHHPATLAVAWVMAQPGVTAPLIGGRNVEQLTPALQAPTVAGDADIIAQIDALFPVPPPATDRNEETSSHNYGAR